MIIEIVHSYLEQKLGRKFELDGEDVRGFEPSEHIRISYWRIYGLVVCISGCWHIIDIREPDSLDRIYKLVSDALELGP